jgi:chemotaxis protein MotB
MGQSRFSKDSSFSALIWPGFVDALSALLTVVLFVFMIFMISTLYLKNMVERKDHSIHAKEDKIALLRHELAKQRTLTEKTIQQGKEETKLQMQEMERLKAMQLEMAALLQTERTSTEVKLQEKEQEVTQLNEQLQSLLAKKVGELANYRSEFLGRLRKALQARKDVRIVGDRFIFSSEILFDLGSATLGEKGKKELAEFAAALQSVIPQLPKDIPWILRVNGHTDDYRVRPGGKFSSNLELSMMRALSVVDFLVKEGIPKERLVAAGFGEFHPLVPQKHSPKDRRIELMLDQASY